MDGGYPELAEKWDTFAFGPETCVHVPLCGMSEDLLFLASKCRKVIGSEISEEAVKRLFDRAGLTPETEKQGNFTIWRSGNIEIRQGDFFKLPAKPFAEISLIYDKAALVALPKEMRKRYATKLSELSYQSASILLHHFIYDQSEMNGPPFSVSDEEVTELFGEQFSIDILSRNILNPHRFPKFVQRGLSGAFHERFLLLTPKLGSNAV